MKKIVVLISLLSWQVFAADCPDLRGQYHCVFSHDRYSLLTITQYDLSNGITEYSFTHSMFPNDPDLVTASVRGEYDSFGWINQCEGRSLRSISVDGSMTSEIYLDQSRSMVRLNNGRPFLKCPRKN
jgi:hypothetical protein